MPGALEITRALYGAWRLARLDRTGMTWFEASPEGFWRSFFAFAIVAPGYAVLKLVEHNSDAALAASAPRILVVDAIAYVVQIVAYPLAMLYLCRAFGRWDRYIGFVVALNWSVVLQMALLVPTTILAASQAVSAGLGDTLALTAVMAVLFYQWFITRTALEVPGIIAAGAVLLKIVIELVIAFTAYGLLQASPVVPGAGS